MYIPSSNRVDDPQLLQAVMQDFNFAILVSTHENQLVATHLPMMFDAHRGEHGTLITHLARANQQWKSFLEKQEVLVIFQGQHGYISPNWYENHPSVPTWNYITVHTYGMPSIVEDETRVTQILGQLADHHESEFEQPWRMNDLPDDYMEKMLKALVAIEIPISRIEGKFKLSQNRSETDQIQVIQGLKQRPYSNDHALAEVMAEQLNLPQ